MSVLRVTVIDVGWGDSLLLESQDAGNNWHYALIDCNDTSTLRSSHIFLKRYFEKQNLDVPTTNPLFEWVLVTHAHSDHALGIKRILQDYGTRRLLYSQAHGSPVFLGDLLRYAVRSDPNRVTHHESVDTGKAMPVFGDVSVRILWPRPGQVSPHENNNSVVLALTLDKVTFVLTGDAEAEEVWSQIANQIPKSTRVFKVPHHGAENGMFTNGGLTPWLDRLGKRTRLAISSHVRPHPHPDPQVIAELDARHSKYYRTDLQYHLTFETDGRRVSVRYSHV